MIRNIWTLKSETHFQRALQNSREYSEAIQYLGLSTLWVNELMPVNIIENMTKWLKDCIVLTSLCMYKDKIFQCFVTITKNFRFYQLIIFIKIV
jgi:hypothetical protein